MKTALVLEGGAMRGIYTAGVLDKLLEENLKIDAVIGVSAGALFGVNYLSKQHGRAIRYNKKYIKDKNYMGLYSLVKTKNIVNQDFCFNKLINELDPFDYKTFDKSKIKFYATVTNLKTGKAEYKEIKNVKSEMDYLRASGAMPLVSEIVKIAGNEYLDGGMADSIPVLKAKEMGYDRIIVVLTRPITYRKKKSPTFPYKLYYKNYPNFLKTVNNRYKEYNKIVEEIIKLESKKEIFVIRPSKFIKIKRLEKNITKVEAMYNLGYTDTEKQIKNLLEYLK